MLTDRSALLAALRSKDPRFDGRFFVGISSTGIYCRPICKARQAKDENCNFFATAAEAEQAGFRPCLLCRPELAPGYAMYQGGAELAYLTARHMEEHCGSEQRLPEIAERFGCTDRHLRRVFAQEYNTSPIQYLQTCRLLLAKNLLTDTALSVTDVAMTAGFGSLRHFNALFKKHYGLAPTQLRKKASGKQKKQGEITLFLTYRPPYLWEPMLNFLAGRCIEGVEVVKGGKYMRTVRIADVNGREFAGWIKVSHRPQKGALFVSVSETLLPVLPQVLSRVRHLFDLRCDPQIIYDALKVMNDIRPDLCVLGTRLPGSFDAFEMVTRAVLGQQITVKAAGTLAGRIVQTFGKPIKTDVDGLTHTFPTPDDILALDGEIEEHLGKLGVIAARSRTIEALARAFAQGAIEFGLCAQPEGEIKKLMDIRGIGSWTAQYIAMRTMEWPDAFLETDAGIKKALAPHTPKEMLEMSKAWHPWRSYATINLWNSISGVQA